MSLDISGEIPSFGFEDTGEELDVMEVVVSDRHLRFVSDTLAHEGNEIVARFGSVNDLSLRRNGVACFLETDTRSKRDGSRRG